MMEDLATVHYLGELADLRTLRQVVDECPALRGAGRDPVAPLRGYLTRAHENGLAETGAIVRPPGTGRVYLRISVFVRWLTGEFEEEAN